VSDQASWEFSSAEESSQDSDSGRFGSASSGSVRALDLTAPRDPHRPGPRELGGWPRILAIIEPGFVDSYKHGWRLCVDEISYR